jgi:cytochrome P450
MLTQGDAEWSRTRKAFVPAFSTAFLKTLVPLFVARAQIMAECVVCLFVFCAFVLGARSVRGAPSAFCLCAALAVQQRSLSRTPNTYTHTHNTDAQHQQHTQNSKLQGVADARGVAAFHPLATLLTMDIIALVVLSHDADLQRQDPAAPHPLFASFMELLRLVCACAHAHVRDFATNTRTRTQTRPPLKHPPLCTPHKLPPK